MTRPASAFPLASLSVATSDAVPPTVTVTELGASVTEATGKGGGSITVTAEESRLLPLVPRTKRPPPARAWTTRADLTVARATFVLAQSTAVVVRLFDM